MNWPDRLASRPSPALHESRLLPVEVRVNRASWPSMATVTLGTSSESRGRRVKVRPGGAPSVRYKVDENSAARFRKARKLGEIRIDPPGFSANWGPCRA